MAITAAPGSSEKTTPHPQSARSLERLAAEKAWAALAAERGVPLAIFRLAGIYGPGRNALVNLAEGRAQRIVKPGQVFNRIHVDDIVAGADGSRRPRTPPASSTSPTTSRRRRRMWSPMPRR